MLPQLYLHGLASGDFELALRGLLGEGALLSAGSLMRLKGAWQAEYAAWKRVDLSQLELVYWWADSLYAKAGISDRKVALLVIGGNPQRKEGGGCLRGGRARPVWREIAAQERSSPSLADKQVLPDVFARTQVPGTGYANLLACA